ncbi:MAG: hypothetical protein ACTSX6_09505 [Candidatus Heimdallarchaeaceae archaeon]
MKRLSAVGAQPRISGTMSPAQSMGEYVSGANTSCFHDCFPLLVFQKFVGLDFVFTFHGLFSLGWLVGMSCMYYLSYRPSYTMLEKKLRIISQNIEKS